MDPRVLAHFDGDLSLANLSPRKRDRILAAYPPPTHEELVSTDELSAAQAAQVEVLAAQCPGCGYTYDGRGRRRARGLRGRYGVEGHPRQLVLPRLRRPREGRLRPARPRAGALTVTPDP